MTNLYARNEAGRVSKEARKTFTALVPQLVEVGLVSQHVAAALLNEEIAAGHSGPRRS